MDEQFTFFYILKPVEQLAFGDDGKPIRGAMIPRIIGEGHIVHSGRLLCKESREVLKNRAGGTSVKTPKTREKGVPICAVCQEEYKKVSSSAWSAWTNGVPISGGVEVKARNG